MTAYTDRILEILQRFPAGLTAQEVARHLGVPSKTLTSRLSKLAAYGVIKRTRGRIASDAPVSSIYSAPDEQLLPNIDGSADPRQFGTSAC